MTHVLLLNSDWSPIKFINEIRAMKLLLKGRVEIISFDEIPSMWNEFITTPTDKFQIPATIRLLSRVNLKSLTAPRFRKKILYVRDSWSCQYCNKKLGRGSVTIDHIIPRCKGGKTSWNNCVVSCKQCNKLKGDKNLSEISMKLLKQPEAPKIAHFWDLQDGSEWHEHWKMLIPSND